MAKAQTLTTRVRARATRVIERNAVGRSLRRKLLSWRRRRKWERLWGVEAGRPKEHLSQVLPSELEEAVASGWLPKDERILDIGSGRGHISAWLATQGYAATGAELAEEGTKLAQREFGHLSDSLEFITLDICNGHLEPDRFGGLVDRGCFHTIPPNLRDRYLANVASWAKPGARFLVITPVTTKELDPEDERAHELRDREIREFFEPYFIIERSDRSKEPLQRSAGPIPRKTLSGRAFWMIRRDDR